MGIKKPYKRTCRAFMDGQYSEGGRWQYILHKDFAVDPQHYIRAFLVLQKDFQELLEYIEPSDINEAVYSFRTHSLLMRLSIEVEANLAAILIENRMAKLTDNLTMSHYKKLDSTHHLSSYQVMLPVWYGGRSIRTPFAEWKTGGGLPWYQAYNEAKHNRHTSFNSASFSNVVDAMCGLVALLSSQFYDIDFNPAPGSLVVEGGRFPEFEGAIGNYFLVRFPTDWSPDDCYDFNWQNLVDSDPSPIMTLA